MVLRYIAVETWLTSRTGEGESPEAICAYLSKFSLGPIALALQVSPVPVKTNHGKEMMRRPNPSLADLRSPYNILIYLMDRPEVGPLLLEMSFNDLLKAAFFQFSACPDFQNEVSFFPCSSSSSTRCFKPSASSWKRSTSTSSGRTSTRT